MVNVREDYRPHVVGTQYRAAGDAVVLQLATGVEVANPRHLLQGLQDATPTELANIEIKGPGSGLHWPTLDVYCHTLLETDGETAAAFERLIQAAGGV